MNAAPSDTGKRLTGYIATGVTTIAAIFFIYEIIANSGWTIKAEWNMFKSWLAWPLFIVGFVIALTRFGETHWSQDTIIETEYRDGTKTREKSYDITDVLFGHFILPILGHFVIEPLIYAALIYYPLMCVVALLGSLLPYVLSLLVLAFCGGIYVFSTHFDFKGHTIATAALGLLLTGGFGYGGWYIMQAHAPYEINIPHTKTESEPTTPKVQESTSEPTTPKVQESTSSPAKSQQATGLDDSEFEPTKPAGKSSEAKSWQSIADEFE